MSNSNEIQLIMKNTTLLLKHFELGKVGRPVFQMLAPLFQIKAYRINLSRPLKQITNNTKLNYSPRKKQFDRILVIFSDLQSNARNKSFINTKRNDLIQYFNRNGQKSMLYVVSLSNINSFVPTEHLIHQIQCVINSKKQVAHAKGKAKKENKIIGFREQVLFPFNVHEWKLLLQSTFQKTTSISYFKLRNNYFFMQMANLYVMEFSLNRELMYRDLKDFDSFLNKFNFVRYFWQTCFDNEFRARKYSERLIKNLKWRTAQSEDYLLLLIRENNWQRFILMVQDFCISYESIYMRKQISAGPATSINEKPKPQ